MLHLLLCPPWWVPNVSITVQSLPTGVKEPAGFGLMVFRPIAPLPCTDGISCCVIAVPFSNDQILSHHGNVHTSAMALPRCNTAVTHIQQDRLINATQQRSTVGSGSQLRSLVIPRTSCSLTSLAYSVLHARDPQLLPLGECRRTTRRNRVPTRRGLHSPTKKQKIESTKLMTKRELPSKHAEWRKT